MLCDVVVIRHDRRGHAPTIHHAPSHAGPLMGCQSSTIIIK